MKTIEQMKKMVLDYNTQLGAMEISDLENLMSEIELCHVDENKFIGKIYGLSFEYHVRNGEVYNCEEIA